LCCFSDGDVVGVDCVGLMMMLVVMMTMLGFVDVVDGAG
jgi:hypothetical protein